MPEAVATDRPYVGRFAPSPTGLLHAGSLVAALASWLDARSYGGRWLVRIEDVDTPRCSVESGQAILAQLAALHLHPDEPPTWQSHRSPRYAQALEELVRQRRAYGCACTRREIEVASREIGHPHERHGERVYPGTCRAGLRGRSERAVRCRSDDLQGRDVLIAWTDRRLGAQRQNVTREVGDFVLRRADGLWAYQLAVVVDDADQGITHVVRGEDLADNTPRQILLQRALALPAPTYLHTPLVRAADGHKLSKQNGATAIDIGHPLMALQGAARVLGLTDPPGTQGAPSPQACAPALVVSDALSWWIRAWRDHWESSPQATQEAAHRLEKQVQS
jgi:glutamyl-Q tRNA(Asp) synthetase